ncbi:hypothetical protein EDD84_19105 [Burkholderia gladioli]|nr:hypothetical protein [Burkholderia gladioli]AYQ89259.1 hypothetical protein EDD84_19105 [Burkholderia gladioli]
MTTPLNDERRAALSSLITNWFSTLDADGRLLFEFDYFDVSKIDELIDQAIVPTIADAVECVRAASSAAGAELPPFPTMLRKMWSGGDVQRWIDQNIAPLVRNAVAPAAGVPPHVRFSMESTARWLESGCDPRAAAKEIRASLAKLDAAAATPVAATESPSLSYACEVLRDAVAAKSMLAIGMVHGLASFAKEEAAPSALVAAGVAPAACKGKNCGARDGVSHSPECLAEYEAAVTGAVAADGAAIDTKTIAESLERMIVDWYADCERTRLDWKQMAGVIKLRLDRFLKRAAVSPATADERAAFEAWMQTGELDTTPDLEFDGHVYEDWDTQRAYRGWLARASQAAAPADGDVEQLAEARKLLAHASEFTMMQLDEDWHERAAALLALPPPAGSAGAPPAPGTDVWVPKSLALPPAPGWYLVMLATDNDWELMSDTPIQVEFGAYKHMPQAFTHFYDGRPDEDITEAVTYWTRLPAPPRPAAPAAVEFSYALSQHAERWSGSFDSIEGALAEALSGLDDAGKRDRVIWVGQDKPIDIDYDSLAEEVIERIQEQAFDQVGEVADVIGPYEETETKLLSLAIKRWIDEHGQISCYRIDHSIAYGPGAPEYESAIALLRERDGGTS